MAQFKGETVFKKVQIDLEDNILYEFNKEDVKEYILTDLLNKYKGDNVYMEIKFYEHKELTPENITSKEEA